MSMAHVYVLYFFITALSGFLALGITLAALFRSRERILQYYLFFYLAFSLVIVAETLLAYLYTNISPQTTLMGVPFLAMSSVGMSLLILAIPVCTHAVLDPLRFVVRNRIFSGIALAGIIVPRILNRFEMFSLENIEGVLLFPVIVYSFGCGIRRYHTIQDPASTAFMRKWLIGVGCAIPISLHEALSGSVIELSLFRHDIVVKNPYGVVLYPLFYIGLSVMFAHHFVVTYLLPTHKSSDDIQCTNQLLSIEHLCEEYRLSPREKDVFVLVLQGYGNAQIGETLYISTGTVKAHVNKIYQKTGTKSRYELLARFKHIPLLSPLAKRDPRFASS